jgi:hypothetical protein
MSDDGGGAAADGQGCAVDSAVDGRLTPQSVVGDNEVDLAIAGRADDQLGVHAHGVGVVACVGSDTVAMLDATTVELTSRVRASRPDGR